MCKEEKTAGSLQVPLTSAVQRAVNYTGVSESAFYRLQRQIPKPERKSRQDNVVLDDFDKGVFRRTIHELFVCQKQLPSINVFMKTLKVEEHVYENAYMNSAFNGRKPRTTGVFV